MIRFFAHFRRASQMSRSQCKHSRRKGESPLRQLRRLPILLVQAKSEGKKKSPPLRQKQSRKFVFQEGAVASRGGLRRVRDGLLFGDTLTLFVRSMLILFETAAGEKLLPLSKADPEVSTCVEPLGRGADRRAGRGRRLFDCGFGQSAHAQGDDSGGKSLAPRFPRGRS